MLRVQQQRPSSEENDSEIDSSGAHETLVRKLRVTEGKKKVYSDQAQNVIRQQSAMIRALSEENSDLKKNLSLAASTQNEIKDQFVSSNFEDLISKHCLYKQQIFEEEKLISELDTKIKTLESAINKKRRNMGGVHTSHLQHVVVQKQLRVMENRQDKALVRFNTALATNASLRNMIDHLRQEKRVFEGLQKKLQRELIRCKCEMGEVIEKSTSAYSAREDAQTKLLALKDKADKELAQYRMELKELIRVIDHDQRLRNFMSRKDQERSEAHREIEATRRRKLTQKTEEREKTVMSYEEAFKSIQEATGITDIDQLVSRFIEVEDENFALFNYVNELSGNMELIQEAISGLKEEMEQFQQEGVTLEQQRQTILQDLEAKLKSAESDTQVSEGKYSASGRVLDQLKSGIDSVFSKIGCDSATITELLGGHAGVTDNTVLQYLGIVEQRTNELLQLQAFLQAKESDDPEAAKRLLMIRSSLPSLTQPSLVLPSTTSEHSIEGSEDEGVPLTQEELRQRAIKGLHQHEARKMSLATNTIPPSTAIPHGTKRSTTSEKKRSAIATR